MATVAVLIALAVYGLTASGSAAVVVPARCQVPAFRAFASRTWTGRPWQRGAPSAHTYHAAQRAIGCAPPEQHRVMRALWQRDRERYFAHRHYCLSGPVFAGRISEFSGGRTADGVHTAAEPGIALRSEATLGDTFYLHTKGGTDYVTQTDWGPASWTGREIDITKAEMARIGWARTDSWGEARLIPRGCGT